MSRNDPIDISMPLSSVMPIWPGSPGFSRSMLLHPDQGDAVVNSAVSMDIHVGTHVDAPSHHDPGAATVDELPLSSFIGPATVVQIDETCGVVTGDVLESAVGPSAPARLLLRTANSERQILKDPEFQPDFVALDPSGAAWVAAHGVLLIGIDYLSIQQFSSSNDTHKMLFDAGVVVLEGLDLADCAPGDYTLVSLPIHLPGAEASPVRAILLPNEAT
jgi:arylformamidase